MDDLATFAVVGVCDVDAVLSLRDLSGISDNLYSINGLEERGSRGRLITSDGDADHDLSVSFSVATTLVLFIYR